MMRVFLTVVLLVMIMPVHAAEFWNRLWHNADQQGEKLMQQGDANNAARVYADPHRKAYAKLKAGDYAGAAKDLTDLHDSDADYNRGNALAHAGDLQGALDAYDAALKSEPNNQDAKHNRELVANALKQQPPQQQKQSDKKSQDDKKDGKQEQQKDAAGQNKQDEKSKPGSKDGQGKDGKQGQPGQEKNKANDSKTSDGSQQGKDGSKSQNDKEQDGQSRNGKSNDGKSQDGKQAGQDKNAQQSQAAQAGKQPDKQSGKQQAAAKDEAEQARRDAEASLEKPAAEGKDGAGAGEEMNAGKAMQAQTPRSEKQIAQEQWLRSIPDDPGGLLRRKFLIEHMMRQQKAQQ